MLSDRTYTRNDYPRSGRGALKWLISAIAAGFILEAVFGRMFNSAVFTEWLQLTFAGLKSGHVWQLATYGFIHPLEDVSSVLVVGVNLLCLYFLGRELESLLGTRHFLVLYFGAILLGAVCWAAVNFRFSSGVLTGAWPGIVACLTLFALLNPEQEVRILVMFALPVTIKTKYVVWFLFVIDFCCLAIWEIRGQFDIGSAVGIEPLTLMHQPVIQIACKHAANMG